MSLGDVGGKRKTRQRRKAKQPERNEREAESDGWEAESDGWEAKRDAEKESNGRGAERNDGGNNERSEARNSPVASAKGNMSSTSFLHPFSNASLLSKPLITNFPKRSTQGSQVGKVILVRLISWTGFSSRFSRFTWGSRPGSGSGSGSGETRVWGGRVEKRVA